MFSKGEGPGKDPYVRFVDSRVRSICTHAFWFDFHIRIYIYFKRDDRRWSQLLLVVLSLLGPILISYLAIRSKKQKVTAGELRGCPESSRTYQPTWS